MSIPSGLSSRYVLGLFAALDLADPSTVSQVASRTGGSQPEGLESVCVLFALECGFDPATMSLVSRSAGV